MHTQSPFQAGTAQPAPWFPRQPSVALQASRSNLRTCLQELAAAEGAHGSSSPEVATALQRLALCWQRQKAWSEAATLYERALTIVESALNWNAEQARAIREDLAQLEGYRREHPFQKFLSNCLEAARRRKHTAEAAGMPLKAGPNPRPEALAMLRELGAHHLRKGKLCEAETCFKHALHVLEESTRTQQEEEARLTNNLACVYRCQRKYAEAQALCKRSLAIVEETFASDISKMRKRLINLASIQYAMNRKDEAVATLLRLADLYRQQKRYAEADCCSRRSRTLGASLTGRAGSQAA